MRINNIFMFCTCGLFALMLWTGCASAPKSFTYKLSCGATAITAKDLGRYGLNPQPGKIVVVRVFASWCPFCKEDLTRIAALFKSGAWKPDRVQLFLIAYKNHGENKSTFDLFNKKQLATYGLPLEAVELVYLDKTYAELLLEKSQSGSALFEGWQGVPFAFVFGKDERLVYRGQFTTSDEAEDHQYKSITALQSETCH